MTFLEKNKGDFVAFVAPNMVRRTISLHIRVLPAEHFLFAGKYDFPRKQERTTRGLQALLLSIDYCHKYSATIS